MCALWILNYEISALGTTIIIFRHDNGFHVTKVANYSCLFTAVRRRKKLTHVIKTITMIYTYEKCDEKYC